MLKSFKPGYPKENMVFDFTFPDVGEGITEGEIVSWKVKEGDQIKQDQVLAEVETDKADLEIESFHEGTILQINAPEGTTVMVGELIAVIGEEGESEVKIEVQGE